MVLSEVKFPDVSVMAVGPRQTFKTNFSKLPLLALNTYLNLVPYVKDLHRIMAKEEFVYYATALLWIRILDIKRKQGKTLSTAEMDILFGIDGESFNVPEPIFDYLSQIGNVVLAGAEMEIMLPALPVTVANNRSGYHAALITEHNHNLFEEVPSLGIAADVVMALTSDDDTPTPLTGISAPHGAVFTENLTGLVTDIGPRKEEVKKRLSRLGIDTRTFPEDVPGTRFCLTYVRSLSNLMESFQTYNILSFRRLSQNITGGKCQIILTKPVPNEDMHVNWTKATVEATAAAFEYKVQFGAAYVFGFQLFKEAGAGKTDTARAARWSCVVPDPDIMDEVAPWIMPHSWIESRNERRDLPPFYCTERFKGFGRRRQDEAMSDYVRRMLCTPH